MTIALRPGSTGLLDWLRSSRAPQAAAHAELDKPETGRDFARAPARAEPAQSRAPHKRRHAAGRSRAKIESEWTRSNLG